MRAISSTRGEAPKEQALNDISLVRSPSTAAPRNESTQPEAGAVRKESAPGPAREGDPALVRSRRPSAAAATASTRPRSDLPAVDVSTQTAPPAAARGLLARGASAFWRGANVNEWTKVRGDDAAFVRQVGGGAAAQDVELGGGHTLRGIAGELDALEAHLPALRDSDQVLANTLASSLKKLKGHVATLDKGVPTNTRLLKAMVNFGINWFPVLAPSPAFKNEAMTFAYTAAAAMNAMALVGSSAMSQAASGWPVPFGGGVLGDQSNEAHLYPWLIGMQFLPSESIVKFAKEHSKPGLADAVDKFTGQTWYHALLGVAAGAVLAQPLFGNVIGNGAKSAYKKVMGPGASPEEITAAAAARIGRATVDEIHGTLSRLREHGSTLQELRLAHAGGRPGSPEITRAMNSLITLTLDELGSLDQRVQKRIGPAPAASATQAEPVEPTAQGEPTTPSEPPKGISKAETTEKYAYAAVAAAFAIYTIIAVQPEVIATVDLSADAGVLIMAMLALAMSSTATAKDARNRLLNMASTTMTGAVAFTGDLIAKKGFPDKFPEGLMARNPLLGAAVVMVMVALLPQHIANGVLAAGSGVKSGAQRVAGEVTGLWRGRQAPAAEPKADTAATTERQFASGARTPEDPTEGVAAVEPALVNSASSHQPEVTSGGPANNEPVLPEHLARMVLQAWEQGIGGEPTR